MDERHGTYGFAQRCDECKAAFAEHMREYRSKNLKKHNEQKKQQQLRNKAVRILAQRHPQELQKIISELRGNNEA